MKRDEMQCQKDDYFNENISGFCAICVISFEFEMTCIQIEICLKRKKIVFSQLVHATLKTILDYVVHAHSNESK